MHAVFFNQNTSHNLLIHTLNSFEYKFEFAKIFKFEADPPMWPPRRIRSYNVALPRGSDPVVWPPPWDPILRYGPSRGIVTMNMYVR